jgi:hypothetical protein
MKRLIVNADDFGFTRGVNLGIIRAFKEGILTSTTMMAIGPLELLSGISGTILMSWMVARKILLGTDLLKYTVL